MPPRANVHDLNESTLGQWYRALPVVTRALFTCYILSGTLIFFNILPTVYMYHAWNKIFVLPIPQVWRLVTNFMVIGQFSLNFLFQIVWLIQYGGAYESAKFAGNTADAFYMVLIGMSSMMFFDLICPWFLGSVWHGPSLIFMLLYLWSKNNPNSQVGLFGIIKFQAVYLPFALLFIDVIQGHSVKPGIVGILAGHLYYFLTEVYPRASGRYYIQTPQWLLRTVHRYGLGRVPRAAVATPHPSDNRFRAFSGSARRLAD